MCSSNRPYSALVQWRRKKSRSPMRVQRIIYSNNWPASNINFLTIFNQSCPNIRAFVESIVFNFRSQGRRKRNSSSVLVSGSIQVHASAATWKMCRALSTAGHYLKAFSMIDLKARSTAAYRFQNVLRTLQLGAELFDYTISFWSPSRARLRVIVLPDGTAEA